jgi:predicted transposase YdaD
MPILTDFRDNDYYGPLFRECEARGRFEGKVEGQLDGERMILRRQISKRFGSVPEWVNERIEKLDAEQLMEVGDRLLDAKSLSELFG